MMEKKKDPYDWTTLFRVSNAMHWILEKHSRINCNNITIGQAKVAEEVFYHSSYFHEGIRLKELAKVLGISPSAASQMVETLVRTQVLERTISDEDRRAVTITSSRKALELHKEHQRVCQQIFSQILKDVSPEDVEVFSRVLEQIKNGLEKVKEGMVK